MPHLTSAENPYRTHTCVELRPTHVGQIARISGWIHNKRDLGGVLFIDVRDHYGITQILVPPTSPFQEALSHLQKETVVMIEGTVRLRPAEKINAQLETGEVELEASRYEVLGSCQPLPMNVFPEDHVPEEVRLKYRFLDLRRSELHQTILLRSRVIASIRRRMIELGFTEFQTPILTSSSPEGARDFLVPSRLYPGEFYALPQAPQQFKQLLMVSGFDRYFQIAPCFRDEDGRADRTPGEFYQLDLEMSFVTQEDVFLAMESLFSGLFSEFKPEWSATPAPFPRIAYADSMLKYGSDKPDLRIPVEISDLTPLFANSEFKAFGGKTVRVMAIPQAFEQPRSWFDSLQDEAKKLGAPGLAYVKISDSGKELAGPIAKFLASDEIKAALLKVAGTEKNAVLFFSADKNETRAAKVLGAMRVKISEQLNLITKPSEFKFAWIVDYPMYEYNEETKAVEFSHNPFSMPQGGLEALEKQDPLTIKAYQYDLVCNGYELASGAIRNHVPEIMFKAFAIAGYDQQTVENRFAGMINAFRFGAPPHGGMAPGIDRIVMLLSQHFNIRDVIAFPMAQNGRDLLMNAPAPVSDKQLTDVHLSIKKPVPKA